MNRRDLFIALLLACLSLHLSAPASAVSLKSPAATPQPAATPIDFSDDRAIRLARLNGRYAKLQEATYPDRTWVIVAKYVMPDGCSWTNTSKRCPLVPDHDRPSDRANPKHPIIRIVCYCDERRNGYCLAVGLIEPGVITISGKQILMKHFQVAGKANADRPVPGLDPHAEPAAKDWLSRFSSGSIDRTKFTQQVDAQLTAERLAEAQTLLQPLGKPTHFLFIRSEEIEGATGYDFLVTFSGSTRVVESIAFDKFGKLAGINFQTLVRE
ncbi:MAG: hypothetical protein NVSMB31_08490 [Vulcanimicrobiaceae bacterium]